MSWSFKPTEVLDEAGHASGRYRMTAVDEDDPLSLAHGVTTHDHPNELSAMACDVCDEYTKHIAGQLSRTEQMWKEREADVRRQLGYPPAGDTSD
tara:strand:- start:137 stop:421 length:285 start_codon:yes stop_codon:yes gene_type:complete